VEEKKDLNQERIKIMRAFKVDLNGKKLCLAGIGDKGVLTAVVSWVAGTRGTESFLEVGGLASSLKENFAWVSQKPVSLGDEILIKIVNAKLVDPPDRRYRTDSKRDLANRKAYVRAVAKELGWTVKVEKKAKSLKRSTPNG
jgi:hypothetical protein